MVMTHRIAQHAGMDWFAYPLRSGIGDDKSA
jgi:hypothetical protein